MTVGTASAATPKGPGGPTVDPFGQMTRQQWATLKADLKANSVSEVVTESAGTRTFTYTIKSGSTLVLSEPTSRLASVTPGAAPNLYFGGCGWFQLCVYLNRADQGALAAGGAAGIAAVLCLAGGPVVCVAAAIAAAIAASYVSSYGFCPGDLQIEVAPWPGSNLRCV